MKNVVILYKNEEDELYCRQITDKGLEYMVEGEEMYNPYYWEQGGTILLDELMEILDKEI